MALCLLLLLLVVVVPTGDKLMHQFCLGRSLDSLGNISPDRKN